MSEIELKYSVEPARAGAVAAALGHLPLQRATLETRYFDTPDHDLARARLTLRLRRCGRAWEQTLKAEGASAVDRFEETVPRPGRWPAGGPAVDPGLHRDGEAGARLASALRGDFTASLLQPVCVSRIRRRSAELEVDGARIEIAFDEGTIEAATRNAAVCEVEYELKAGDARQLLPLAREGVAAHGLWLSTLSKFERGDGLARDLPHPPAAKARAPCLDGSMNDAALVQEVVRACLDHILANASIVASGTFDDEAVHQLRVALRRLRTAARELGALDGIANGEWLVAITHAFRALGEYRDRGNVAAALKDRLVAAGSPEPTVPAAPEAVPDPVAVVRDASFQFALLDVLACTLGEPVAIPQAPGRKDASGLRKRAGARLAKLQGALAPAAKGYVELDPAAQHRVRKRLKRLRYLAELVGPLFARRKVERYLDSLKPAQDALGVHNDLAVGLVMARAAVERGDAAAWFNVGWLSAERRTSARGCAKALARAAKARPFW